MPWAVLYVMTESFMLIEAIRVDGRHRKDLGDLSGLIESIQKRGLINPITVTEDGRLLAGGRRLAAVRALGHKAIAVRIVTTQHDAAEELRIERDENVERIDMKPSELVSLGLALEELERPRAEARVGGRPKKTGDPVDTGFEEQTGKTREIVASALGISPSSYDRAKTVVAAAGDESLPASERRIAQEALDDMDRTGLISPSFNRVKEGLLARVGPRKLTHIESAAKQRRAISSAETALSGICHGLGQITELHEEITTEEAARWVDSLWESRRVIASLISLLRERINAQQS